MSFSDTPSACYVSNAENSSSQVHCNYVNYKRSRTVDYTTQVEIIILWAAKFLRFA